MDGFKRPTRPSRPETPSDVSRAKQPDSTPLVSQPESSDGAAKPVQPTEQATLPPVDIGDQRASNGLSAKKPKRISAKAIVGIVIGLLALLALVYVWYTHQLTPVDGNDDAVQRVEILDGASFDYVSTRLEERGLIRSKVAFEIFAALQGKRNAVKAGTCDLRPSESAAEILAKVTKGCHDFKSLTFYPGGTIEKPLFKPVGSTVSQNLYVKYILKKSGYSDVAIDRALAANYDSPLFAGKPNDTTLEGYIFGETYYVATDATPETVLKETFAEMYRVVQQNDLIAKYKARNLNLYEGITLASIVQKELNCEDKPTKERKDTCYGYQRKIASVFYNRLAIKMPLGSDSTFIYAADMQGVPATSKIDSDYNTYKNVGLPPGPIASPGELALRAAANPESTDYLYFVAGDDGLIYFSRTQKEHEQNTRDHCQKACAY